jgi:Holliday junction DNA helicase RuvA
VIGSLRGLVAEVLGSSEVLVEVGGVGYRVAVPTTALAGLAVGLQVFLHVHTHVREDAIVLYGFTDRAGRDCFEGLIAAHGVGPALALAILSVHTPAELTRAVLAGDSKALTLVPGVGPKTAARLLIDLEPRFARLELGPAGKGSEPGPAHPPSSALGEVRAALASLGYGPDEVRAAITALDAGDDGVSIPVEELLRAALRELGAARRRVMT